MKALQLIFIIAMIFESVAYGQDQRIENERLDSVVTYHYYSDFDSTRYRKKEFSYDSSNNLTLEAYYGWDPVKNVWIGDRLGPQFGKSEYSYDLAGNNISGICYYWDYNLNICARSNDVSHNQIRRLIYCRHLDNDRQIERIWPPMARPHF